MHSAAFDSKPTPAKGEVDRLREAYRRADLRHECAVNELTRQRETAQGEDLDKLANRVHKAGAKVAETFHALKLFESQHP
jgi:hypothetical protein